MVHGTVHLDNGETVILMAEDMLTALKMANEKYWSKVRRIEFATVDDRAIIVEWKQPPEEVMQDGGCEVDQACDGTA